MGSSYQYRKSVDIVVRIVAKPGLVLFGPGLHYSGFELNSPVYAVICYAQVVGGQGQAP